MQTFQMCTSICTHVDKLGFSSLFPSYHRKRILLYFQSWASYHKLFSWSLVMSNNFKALELGFRSLAGEDQQSSVLTTIWKATCRLANAFKALQTSLAHTSSCRVKFVKSPWLLTWRGLWFHPYFCYR